MTEDQVTADAHFRSYGLHDGCLRRDDDDDDDNDDNDDDDVDDLW